MKLKEIIFAIITITTIHQVNAHNHWEPSKDCLNGQIEAWQCCLASEATIYLKHPKHCNLYFRCAHKYLELKQCQSGYHWSVKHQKCKKPEEAQCENTSVITTTTTPKPSQWQLPEGCYDGFITVDECCQMSQRWYELVPDQNDCHKFYKCYKGKSYHLSCPPHFKWSHEKRKCVYSSHTSCDIKTTTTTTTDASAVTTSESNIITVAPERLPNGCYDGSIEPSKCCKMDIGKSTLIGENFDLDEFNKQRHHHHHSSSSEEKIFNNELLADPKDCHKYYKCALGKPLHLSCPYHTKWNIQSSKCVYAFNTKCTDPEPTTSTTTTEGTTTETTTTTTAPAPWRLPNGCYDGFITAKECCNIEIGKTIRDIQSLVAENFDLETNLRHHHHSSEEQLNWNNETLADPKDCHKYFQCKSGKPVHLSCPSHNKWSIELGKCVYSENKKCTDLDFTTSSTTTTTTKTEATITTEIPITTTVETITTTQAPWRLPDDCYDGSIKASQCCKIEKDKRDFIIMSLIAESFDSEDNTKHHSSSSSSNSNEVKNWNNETLADPKDCHKYYQCKSGKPVHISCPNHNVWNIELGKCVYSNSKKCKDLDPTTTKPTITSTESSTITTPPVSSTTAAPWRLPQGCYDGSFKAPNCCKIKINETMDLSSSSISSSKERQDISLKSLIAENFDLIESTRHSGSKSSEEENNFNTESLADPKNCHKYFKCQNGKPIHKSCPKHTKWNIELGQCVYAIFEKCSDQEPTATPTEETTTEITITKTVPTTIDSISTTAEETTTETNITTTESSEIETTTLDYITTTEATSSTTSYETTSTELSTSTSEDITTTEGPTATDETTTPEVTTTSEKTSTETATSTSDKPTTTEATTISEGPTTTEVAVTSKDPTTTEISNTSEGPTTTEEFITTEALSSTEKTTSISEVTTTTEAATVTENPATPEVTTISEETKTTEKITTTEAISSTETATSTSEKTSTEAAITTEPPTTSEETTTAEAVVTTSTSEETITTEATITTDEATSSEEITTTEIGSTTKTETTNESITTTVEIETTTESITNNTEDASTTEAITTTEDFSTITTESVTSTETTAKPITTTTGDGTSTTEATTNTTEELTTIETPATITTEMPTTKEDTATTTEAITTSTQTTTTVEDTATPEPTFSTTERSTTTEDSVTTTITTTTELSNNSTTEANTDPTPDPNGSCGTASYKCRHGIISAEECCKGVPYWEDRLLQNNDNCGTYFQCVHEIPQVRMCPAGLYWNADVCRCEWKQLSTCNF